MFPSYFCCRLACLHNHNYASCNYGDKLQERNRSLHKYEISITKFKTVLVYPKDSFVANVCYVCIFWMSDGPPLIQNICYLIILLTNIRFVRILDTGWQGTIPFPTIWYSQLISCIQRAVKETYESNTCWQFIRLENNILVVILVFQ